MRRLLSARHDVQRSDSPAVGRDAATDAWALMRASPPRCWMYSRAGSAYIGPAAELEADGSRSGTAAEHLRENAREWPGRGPLRRLIERGDGERLPEPRPNRRTLTMTDEPFANGLESAAIPDRRSSGTARRSTLMRSARQRLPLQHTRQQVQGRWKVRASQAGQSAPGCDERHLERRLQANVALCPNAPEKRKGVAVATEQHVLAVVDQLTGHAVWKRSGAPSLGRASNEHPRVALRKAAAARPENPAPMMTTSNAECPMPNAEWLRAAAACAPTVAAASRARRPGHPDASRTRRSRSLRSASGLRGRCRS